MFSTGHPLRESHIRGDAILALTEFGHHARDAVPMLLKLLSSSESTLHDKTGDAWALPRIGAADEESLPSLLTILDRSGEQTDAGELRRCVAEAIEQLTDSFRVLVPLARRCLSDPHWRCRLHGLVLVERLGKRHKRLLPMLVPNVEPLVDDEVEEIRAVAQRIEDG